MTFELQAFSSRLLRCTLFSTVLVTFPFQSANSFSSFFVSSIDKRTSQIVAIKQIGSSSQARPPPFLPSLADSFSLRPGKQTSKTPTMTSLKSNKKSLISLNAIHPSSSSLPLSFSPSSSIETPRLERTPHAPSPSFPPLLPLFAISVLALVSCSITRYYDSFVRGYKLWIVMEYLAGGSCLDLVRPILLFTVSLSLPSFRSSSHCRLTPSFFFNAFSNILQLKPGVFSETHIAIVCRELLFGLEYLHSEGKIHRDIKAANVLLSAGGRVKLGE